MKNKLMEKIEDLFQHYEKNASLCLKLYDVIKEADPELRPELFKRVSLLFKRPTIIEVERLCNIDELEIERLAEQLLRKNDRYLDYAYERCKRGVISLSELDRDVWNYIESFDTLHEKAFVMYDIGVDVRYPYFDIGQYTKHYLLSDEDYCKLVRNGDLEKQIKLKCVLRSEEFIQYTQVAYAILSLLNECKSDEEKIVLIADAIQYYKTRY